jgi:hypothetical protein
MSADLPPADLPPVPLELLDELGVVAEDDASLAQARDWLTERLDAGGACPCCRQHAERYNRPLHAKMAADLIRMAVRFGVGRAFHVRELGGHPGDFAKLALWGLIADLGERRPDGGRAGWWRVTVAGARFVAGHSRVPAHCLVYAGEVQAWDPKLVGIEEALGKRFRVDELRGRFHWPADESGRITAETGRPVQTSLLELLEDDGEAAA